MDDQQLLRYSRHILLDEIGIEGQEKLLAAHALVIGAGGLGSPVALYLASAGIGKITLVDDDTVDLTNLQRQILHTTARVGQPKAESGKQTLADINPEVKVIALQERADEDRLHALVGEASVVLDCTDNFRTRHAINRACVNARVPLVSGAAIRMDGQVAVFDPRGGDELESLDTVAAVKLPGGSRPDFTVITITTEDGVMYSQYETSLKKAKALRNSWVG